MRGVYFTHSLVSDWNHGNAHFLRGVMTELIERGHVVKVYEPRMSWSLANLVVDHGAAPVEQFHRKYPLLDSEPYDPDTLDLDDALRDVDLVIVHEWNEPELVARIGRHHRRRQDYLLLFHDTHHRAVTAPEEMGRYDLRYFDGVLAFGEVLRDIYLREHWSRRAWVWHEAADVRVFQPMPAPEMEGDLIWIGNWGDEERNEELRRFLIDAATTLGLRTRIHGVRYPNEALSLLERAGIEYAGWIPNHQVPRVFGRFGATVHVPRRPYARALPGIPTIRPFEAMACGIPLVCSPWDDTERLFTAGEDYLVAQTPKQMRRHLRMILTDRQAAAQLADRARRTILDRHTCAHRVDELLAICEEAGVSSHVTARPAGEMTPRVPSVA